MASDGGSSLPKRFANELPEGYRFTIHHFSSPPTDCPAIFAAPAGQKPEETYCESHFLSISIENRGQELQVFAIEVLIYTTKHLTTLFVSKADSTGYLHLLDLPKGTPSPLRVICTTFLTFLVEERSRPDRTLVLSLFARAQDQYLFPGSIENKYKHVLDDRALIKWWCKAVDPLLAGGQKKENGMLSEGTFAKVSSHASSLGYLKAPGCDKYETRGFFPKGEHDQSSKAHRWIVADPLQQLARSATLPERCLVPRFPDDPKARFLIDLDDELPEQETPEGKEATEGDLSRSDAGRWRSVKSLDQFWEMMSFRQECSAGRLVGFLWAVFKPLELQHAITNFQAKGQETPSASLPTPLDSQHQETDKRPLSTPLRSSPSPEVPSTPRSIAEVSQAPPTPSPVRAKETQRLQEQPERTDHYLWPSSSRGELVLSPNYYNRVGDVLLRLDYADQEVAMDSTKKWIDDVAQGAGVKRWGRAVVGEKKTAVGVAITPATTIAPVMMLNAGLVRKKKRPVEDGTDGSQADPASNMLSASLVRKKAKTNGGGAEVAKSHT